ncbi:MAG: fibronectin type III domain-containing protein [Acidimicrobiia bacterium]|nr:fibronectin type III domain-containing protein [Acidimicrobiia bacterium]
MTKRRPLALVGLLTVGAVTAAAPAAEVVADHTATPSSVAVVGDLQSELGCAGDWDPTCTASGLADANADGVWKAAFDVPSGAWQYKTALNGGWDENYGRGGVPGGDNIPLELGGAENVTFFYDHRTHWVTDNHTSVVATAAGSMQSELGCPGDWDPTCLRSMLQDPDEDGVYTLETTALPTGTYEFKVAIDEGWTENYGEGGAPDGPNIPFTVTQAGQRVTFRYDAVSHVPTVQAGHGPDGNVEWDGVRHDSRDTLYRTPGGAVPAGTEVRLRLRTFHDDVTAVAARIYSFEQGGQTLYPMAPAATDVDCYEAALDAERCDFWEITLPDADPDNLWYRFVVTDGADTDYYADDTPALDGGIGAATDEVVDQSWALMVHVPGAETPEWASDAVIYQIFPDRFRNGSRGNDAETGDVRYDDPVLALPWGTLPEGYCRNYADGNTNCPWRFDDTPPDWSPTKEQPRGRDYMGGDLNGVRRQLDTLQDMGITAIYFNPIFDAGSNHSYDTQRYTRIDPYFGTAHDWRRLVRAAERRGIRIILDGVFNHMSSDSPFFDRYHHYGAVGACESVDSPWRDWFVFRDEGGGPCAGPTGPNTMNYEGWFGFDTIPVMDKANPEVQEYFLTDGNSITRRWLERGAAGWRLDVSGDPSFPEGYWETFRQVVDETDPDALTISETWQKDTTLLRMLRGDRLDTTMNYRLRDAVIGLLAPQAYDAKGFPDSGNPITPTDFAERIEAIREDYPDAAYFALMNLLDSHDTERLLWTLTPGEETRAAREEDEVNVAEGQARMRLASLIQFTMAGAPTVYYGDEVAMTGDDDPDDRRTYPWAGQGGEPDLAMRDHYDRLAMVRRQLPALTGGDLHVLLADDAAGTVAYGRSVGNGAAIVAINTSAVAVDVSVPVAGWLADGTFLRSRLGVNGADARLLSVTGGTVRLSLPAYGALLLATNRIDLTPPAAPTGVVVTDESPNRLTVDWDPVPGAASYRSYYSPLSGGGWVLAEENVGTEVNIEGLDNARTYYVIVRAVDAAGNESVPSEEVSGVPHLFIDWAAIDRPPAMTHVISTTDRTDDVYGRVFIRGYTQGTGATESLQAQLGYGSDGSDPAADDWRWVDARFDGDVGTNNFEDQFVASLQPEAIGEYDYAYRFSTTAGRDWLYADLNGNTAYSPEEAGQLTVTSSGDTTAPAVPSGLEVVTASPGGVELSWDAVGDADVDRYEVGRSDASGGPYTVIGTAAPSADPGFTDLAVADGATYFYVVRAVDTSFNRSDWSDEVTATAELRTVTLTYTVTVPASTDGTGRLVNIAGFLDRLDGDHPQWDPGGTPLTRVDATTWTITFTGLEGTPIEYKYALASWDYVEKDAACGEVANRPLTLVYDADGVQEVNDTVENWRNVAPCGN